MFSLDGKPLMKLHIEIAVLAVSLLALPSAPVLAREPATVAVAGSSFGTNIRVPTGTEHDGIRWERSYLAPHYRGARLLRQRLGNHAGHVYDIMTIATTDGKQQDVYFKITSYFGHFYGATLTI